MKKWSNKKAEWLLVMLAVSLTASASWTITAEEKSEAIDRYIIVELETLTVPNVDAEEMKLSSESEQSTEETVEVESEPEVVLFSLQDSLDSEEYSVTGISVDEPIIATVYKGNIIKNLIMDCQSYTKYRPNETTGGIFVSWRRKEELPTGA